MPPTGMSLSFYNNGAWVYAIEIPHSWNGQILIGHYSYSIQELTYQCGILVQHAPITDWVSQSWPALSNPFAWYYNQRIQLTIVNLPKQMCQQDQKHLIVTQSPNPEIALIYAIPLDFSPWWNHEQMWLVCHDQGHGQYMHLLICMLYWQCWILVLVGWFG